MKAWNLQEGLLTKAECLEFREWALHTAELKDATIGRENRVDPGIRRGKVSWPIDKAYTDGSDIFQSKILPHIIRANKQHFGLDIDIDLAEWQFTHYGSKGDQSDYYSSHMDSFLEGGHIGQDLALPNKTPVRKLSIVVQLSEPWEYSGGSLGFMGCENPRYSYLGKIGTAILFPSFMIHSVSPLVSGDRYSLVGWICGPWWR